ncbi:MAG: undecaprenyl-diphosphatase UppP [Patescibacteria group bacterium]
MATLLTAIFFGIVQGLTEFLPVSSTAHLILLEKFLHLSPSVFGLSFDAALHLGTLLSLLLYFWTDLLRLVRSFLNDLCHCQIKTPESRLVISLIFATVPAAVLGFLLEKKIETVFRDPALIALALLFGSLIFYLAERFSKITLRLENLGTGRSLVLGFSQALALIPGISRSGITVSGGLLLGVSRAESGYFVFLLSIPIIFGAGLKSLFDAFKDGVLFHSGGTFIVGFAASAITGYFVVKYFLAFLKNNSLTVFIWYRVFLALLVLFFMVR